MRSVIFFRVGIVISSAYLLLACSTPSIVATRAITDGDKASNSGKYDQAISHYEEYLALSPRLGLYRNVAMESAVYRKLAHALATQGKYKQAIHKLEKALSIDLQLPDNQISLSEDYRMLGMVNAYLGKFDLAIDFLSKSLQISHGMEGSVKEMKRTMLANTWLSLAQLNLVLGNMKEASVQAYEAYSIFHSIGSQTEGKIESTLLLGIISRERGDLSGAMRWLNESQELAITGSWNTTRQKQAISEVLFLKGEYEKAMRYKLEAVEQAEKSNIKPLILIAYMRLGDGYRQLGNEERATQCYQKALEFQESMETSDHIEAALDVRTGNLSNAFDYYEKSGAKMGTAQALFYLAQDCYSKKLYDSALIYLQRALVIYNEINSHEGESKIRIELAKVFISQERFEQAGNQLTEATALTRQPELHWQIFYLRGIIFQANQQYDPALAAYKEAVRIIEELRSNISLQEFKSNFMDSKTLVYDKIIMLLVTKFTESNPEAAEYAWSYCERARSRSFLDMIGNRILNPKSASDTSLLANEQALRIKLQKLSVELERATNAIALSDELQKTQQSYRELVEQISRSNPAYSSVINIEPVSMDNVRKQIAPNTALLEYWVSENGLAVWIITEKKTKLNHIPVKQIEIMREVVRCRNAIAAGLSDESASSLQRLHQWLIEPIAEAIKPFAQLVIIPHLSLHFIPFQALLSQAGRYLIEDYDISYSPSVSVWYYCTRMNLQPGHRVLAMALGNLSIGTNTTLPGTIMEIEYLADLYPNHKLLIEERFTETDLKKEAQHYDQLHIATHGVFNRIQPMNSFLLASATQDDDGMLTLHEIFNLTLKCKIITLSACETGLGDLRKGDDLVGLSRAFIYAGSPLAVVSLWRVDDKATAWLMTRFHYYLNKGFTASESMGKAQRELLNLNSTQIQLSGKAKELHHDIIQSIEAKQELKIRNPYYWAPFILIGNGFVKW